MENITLIDNPKYGAAEMISSYQKNLRRGLEIAVILHVLLFSVYFLINFFNKLEAGDIKDKPPRIIDLLPEPPSTNSDETKVIKTEDLVKLQKEPTALTPEPVARHLADELTTKTQDELDKITANVSHDGDSVKLVYNDNNVNKIDNNKIEHHIDNVIKNDNNENRTFQGSEVEVIPECVNFAQVRSSMVYPTVAIEAGIEGKVTVKVLVGTDGKTVKIGSITGPEIFYDEVRDKSMNLEFTPGLQGNKAVKVWMYIPFNFKLKN
jgi:outer membrane biosynthesis protein TonB